MKKTVLVSIAISFSVTSFEQTNTVNILPADDSLSIVRKAATLPPSARQLRWQELELTGFLHFTVNTFTDREWGLGNESEQVFNPAELDAKQWVRTCKAAGIKQVIITAKHHDGFCLWPSKYTEHSVKNSPWKEGKGDVVKEVSEACHLYGIGFGVYLSPWDRNSAYYGDSAKYNQYFMNQLTELLTNYGKVDEVWFDGANGEGPNGKKQVYNFDAWYRLIRKLQPTAVIASMGPDVRWVGTESGYGRETEWSAVPINNLNENTVAANSQTTVAFKPTGDMTDNDLGSRSKIVKAKGLAWYPAETDVSIRPGWFYHPSEDTAVKSPEKLLDIYYSSVGRNGVLLLNIPPDRRGLINETDSINLLKWKQTIDNTFETNFVKGSRITTSGGTGTDKLSDGKTETAFTADKDTVTLTFRLKKASSFDVLSLQENITVGQRIESFVLEYKAGDEWKEAAAGTTVGYKRLLRFNTVTAQDVRLRILASRLQPTIAEFGLYKQAQE